VYQQFGWSILCISCWGYVVGRINSDRSIKLWLQNPRNKFNTEQDTRFISTCKMFHITWNFGFFRGTLSCLTMAFIIICSSRERPLWFLCTDWIISCHFFCLCSPLFAEGRGTKPFAEYFSSSETHFVCAGYVSALQQWEKFLNSLKYSSSVNEH